MAVNIDMHCHLLPGIDDGSNNSKESIEIIKMMKEAGAEKIYFTPHLYSTRINTNLEEIEKKFIEFKKHTSQFGVALELGSEVFFRPEVATEKVIPLGSTNFLLIELPDKKPAYFWELLEKIQLRGYIIVLAHIERYKYLYQNSGSLKTLFNGYGISPDILRLKNMGVYFQVNWSTLVGLKRNSKIYNLYKKGLIDFTGSDKHDFNDLRTIIDFGDERYSRFRNQDFL